MTKALECLRAFKRPTVDEAIGRLRKAQITAVSAMILMRYKPGSLKRFDAMDLDYPKSDGVYWNINPIDDEAFNLLGEMFPCHTDQMVDDLLNNDGDGIVIPIYPVVKDYGFEIFSEMVDDPHQFGEGAMSALMVLLAYLDFGIDDDHFSEANEHFGWEIEIYPITCSEERREIEPENVYKHLAKMGIGEYRLAYQCQFGECNSIFMDWTLDDVMDNEYASLYAVHTVEYLVDEWKKAEPQFNELRYLAEKARKNRWIYQALVRAWNKAMRAKPRKQQPKTLIALFDEEVGDD